VVAMIVNIGCGVAQRGIASPADIDKATKLGLSYPFGPLQWGDRLGARRALFILERLQAFYGEPRYRPSPWLRRARPAARHARGTRLKPARKRLSANGSASAKAFGSRSPATPHRARRTRWH
jgi:3-hydroxyacyl-CoA dehydrogenase